MIILLSLIRKNAGLALILIFGASCSDDNEAKRESAYEYFPIRNGNEWYYRVDEIDGSGKILKTFQETWKMRDDCCMDYYIDEVPQGYWYYYKDGHSIYSNDGTFLTTQYLEQPKDKYFMVSSRDDFRFHWMRGGKDVQITQGGIKQFIYAKDSIYFEGLSPMLRYYTFCKGIGMVELNEIYLSVTTDESGNIESEPFSTRKRTLTGYNVRPF